MAVYRQGKIEVRVGFWDAVVIPCVGWLFRKRNAHRRAADEFNIWLDGHMHSGKELKEYADRRSMAAEDFDAWLDERMHTPQELRICEQLPTTTRAERGHSYNFRPLKQE